MERADVVVAGAGVIGSAAARALGSRGVTAVLLEQFSLGHARGSSHGANRIFRFSYPDAGYVRMAVAAREAWARLEADAAEQLLVTTGGLDAGPGAEACAAAMAECGVGGSWLGEDQLRARFPGIAVRDGERMLFHPRAGVCLADRTVAALQRLAQRGGVAVRAGTAVSAIEPDGDRVTVRTPAGDVSARAVIVAAGPWSEALLSGAVARAPRLTPTVQQVRYFRPRPGAGRWPVLIEWPGAGPEWYAVPQAGGAPGVKVAAHVPGRAVDPRDGPFGETDPALDGEATSYVRQRLPGLDPVPLAAETCLYTMTADEDFVLGREGPVVAAAGCSGHAFKFAPLLGETLAALALGEDPGIPLARFSLARPALAHAPGG